jgi:hypothetical protein
MIMDHLLPSMQRGQRLERSHARQVEAANLVEERMLRGVKQR